MDGFVTTKISLTSRLSVKIKDTYATFEATIEKQCPYDVAKDLTDNEYNELKAKLWDECNAEVDGQVALIQDMAKK